MFLHCSLEFVLEIELVFFFLSVGSKENCPILPQEAHTRPLTAVRQNQNWGSLELRAILPVGIIRNWEN